MSPPARYGVAGLSMLLAALLSALLTPTQRLADAKSAIDLERMIPREFSDWKVDTAIMPLAVMPDQQAKLDEIYGKVLSRTYVNSHGERVMLSIAYGSDQSDALQVHRPEVCYAAQGFHIAHQADAKLGVLSRHLPVKQLVAMQGPRIEPITYWITVGGHVVKSKTEQKIAQLRYGLTRKIPDGYLLRVSNISNDSPAAYRLHGRFITDLLTSIDSERAKTLIGEHRL